MAEQAPLTEARSNLSEIVDDVCRTGSAFTITKHGSPAAVLISHDEYESLIETINVLSDDAMMEAIDEGDRDIDAGDVFAG